MTYNTYHILHSYLVSRRKQIHLDYLTVRSMMHGCDIPQRVSDEIFQRKCTLEIEVDAQIEELREAVIAHAEKSGNEELVKFWKETE